ncbi:ABC transporter ATP-binding protein (plasmid) [Azospirillum baldaniorum]|uniref:ABC transporter, fused ATP-binding/permease protein n=1 Tax=Azospirillum baldaniorum TaxID=1064539 RepID=A0A9P1K0Y3_9PROT|nr:ABC transporter ATP-binding protein [Azospirillum baldaniorum]AWJ94495.1 ABC transporter ATP-binding protein [Azospirillum baldaniorum]NUB07854.1 ABC transporter ATP-binding protein [Azospirillum baldaniorum]TWA71642.1 ATP-binding cassette subfamily B protein [Azospirillum brasilense]CCD03549.1 putative ABC transporter, fused ATP-binding/permease protein [Azospirillum baldaniorum]
MSGFDTDTIPDRPGRFLLRYIRRRPWSFGGLFSVIVAAAGCAVAVQYGMKLLIDAMASPDRAAADVWTPLGLFLGFIAAENVLWRLGGWLGCRTVLATGVDMRLDLFRHLTGHSMRYFSEHLAGSLGNRIAATENAATTIFRTLTWSIVPPVTDFLGAVLVLLTIHWGMAVALVMFAVVVAVAIVGLGLRGRTVHHAFAEQSARTNGELVDVVSNVWTVKAFSARGRERERLRQAFTVEAGAHRRSWMHLEKTRVVHDICLWVMAGSMLLWALLLWRDGTITTGDVVIVSALTFRILHGSRDLAFALVTATQQVSAIDESLRVIARPHDVLDPVPAEPATPGGGAIAFERVSYRYPEGRKVLEDFSLTIPAGQKVGLVGPSGAGKSTIISLIQRLDDVQRGDILIDGQPLTALAQDDLRAKIAVVPQDIALFHRPILENIRYGRPDASDEEVFEAARHAFCDGFIRQLPEGYGTLVGERGVRLSGGQRQRLGIARAFLKNAPILILDEATSALDTQSEQEIQAALADLAQGRTVVAVAHRLSTVSAFDRVLVLVDGRIAEDGHPTELRRRGGLFNSLWQLQAQGFAAE